MQEEYLKTGNYLQIAAYLGLLVFIGLSLYIQTVFLGSWSLYFYATLCYLFFLFAQLWRSGQMLKVYWEREEEVYLSRFTQSMRNFMLIACIGATLSTVLVLYFFYHIRLAS